MARKTIREASHLVHSTVSSRQLETSASQLDGIPRDLEDSVRYQTTRMMLIAGIFLRLPQELIAQSVVVLQRFWTGADGGSMLDCDAEDVAAATVYLVAKPSRHSISPRQLLTVFAFVRSLRGEYGASASTNPKTLPDWHLSEGSYEQQRDCLYANEAKVLRTLGFNIHVALPYALSINYLQALDVFRTADGALLAKRTFAQLNTALLSPQLLYLTHQPCALATASIYLAAREIGVNLPEIEWWEVFDVGREELGFLVVALRSMDGFVQSEQSKLRGRDVPMTVQALRAEISQ
ncbi:hypothetical protein BAUCODRAFT_76639 [Baudoinia panamericana UAMH 10762]|uniref:Cyclin N-terminal domain-containing protein n=1 Tax=Baudoinia panamericana (strain UAMH 10762) TaxID=717646 RepID=M2LF57_BAUPA|nr:uncharacterized protein BAUCODRAFT_76639 [Baudoinia panamericana UAMH 10762]EMC92667.1 hypothetical protein BAUCODRAFT_76639 [Baudoinia panamericana UAMH 10762]